MAGQSALVQHPVAGTQTPAAAHFFMVPQSKPHEVPSHVAVAPAGGAHFEQDEPQLSVEELATQTPLHKCCVPVHTTGVPPAPPVAGGVPPVDAPPEPGCPPEAWPPVAGVPPLPIMPPEPVGL
jgi:hypothetical protein